MNPSIESPDSASVEKSGSDRLKKIHACVNRIKSSEEALDFLEVPKEEWENYIPKLQNQ